MKFTLQRGVKWEMSGLCLKFFGLVCVRLACIHAGVPKQVFIRCWNEGLGAGLWDFDVVGLEAAK